MSADVHLYLHLAGRDGRPERMRHVRDACLAIRRRPVAPESGIVRPPGRPASDIGFGRAGAMHGAPPAIHAKRLDDRLAACQIVHDLFVQHIHLILDTACQEAVWRVCAGNSSVEVAAAAGREVVDIAFHAVVGNADVVERRYMGRRLARRIPARAPDHAETAEADG